jgi:hypothetical protein
MSRLLRIDLILIIAASLLFAAAGFLFYTYQGASEERDRTAQTVEKKEGEAQRIQEQAEELSKLEVEMGNLQADLARAPDVSFPTDVLSIDVADLALGAAAESGARIEYFAKEQSTNQRIGSREYQASNFTLNTRLRLPQVAFLFLKLEEGGMTTMTMDQITLNPATEAWQLNLRVTVYSQRPEQSGGDE